MSARTKTNRPGIYKSTSSRGVTTYPVSFRDPAGKQHWRSFPTMRAALAFQAEQRASAASGRYVEPLGRRVKRLTVADVADRYLDSRRLRQAEGTRVRVRRDVKNHIAATTLGCTPIQAVRKADIDDWLLDRERHLSRPSLLNVAILLRAVLKYAVATDLLVKAPPVEFRASDVEDHDDDPEEGIGVGIHPPSPEEVRLLAKAMPNEVLGAAVLVQFGCGLRLGELLGLRACDVVLVGRRQVRITGQLVRDGGGRRGKPKTKHSRRAVPLAGWVADVLEAHLAAHPASGTEFVFTSPRTGRVVTHHVYTDAFREAVTKVGLPDSTVSHDLRHAFATTMLGAGLYSREVGELLGHADGTLVDKVYGHPRRDLAERAAVGMEQAWTAPARRLALA